MNIHQSDIYVALSHEVKPYLRRMRLSDDKGENHVLSTIAMSDRKVLKLTPYTLKQFEPNTVYTLSGPYGTPDNPTA